MKLETDLMAVDDVEPLLIELYRHYIDTVA